MTKRPSLAASMKAVKDASPTPVVQLQPVQPAPQPIEAGRNKPYFAATRKDRKPLTFFVPVEEHRRLKRLSVDLDAPWKPCFRRPLPTSSPRCQSRDMADVDTSNVRDADLLAELEAARGKGGFGFEFIARMIVAKQEKRDAEATAAAEKSTALAAMPREKRRRVVVREALEASPPDRADIRHMHSVLAVLGLPYERLPLDVREFTRAQGNMSLNVRAGKIMTPNGEWKTQPLPFGPKARLIVMHLCSEAIRTKSPTIELADTFTAFVQEMGFSKSGGERGPLTAFREQLNALAACDMQIGTWNGVSARTRSFKPINDFDVWLSDNPAQRSLWPSTVTFSQDMFDSLKRHAVPYNIRAVRAFAGSARKLDLYFWLGWRVL